MRISNVAVLLAVLVGTTGVARAEERDRLVLPAKRGLIQAFVEVSLSVDAVGAPVAIAPDLWYGVTDKLTVGAVHSTRAATGFTGAVGDGVCVTGLGNGCEAQYSTAGVDARYHVVDGGVAVAADVGVHAGDLDPLQIALKLGAAARWHSGKMAVEIAPSVFLGLTGRDAMGDTGGGPQPNKEVAYVPVSFLYGVAAKLAVGLQSGVVLPFGSGDSWYVPATVAVQLAASRSLAIEAAFTAHLAGSADDAGFDSRTLTIGVSHAL